MKKINRTTKSFIDDEEKIRDLLTLSKNQFLNSYSYLNEDEYDITVKEIFNKLFEGV